ncbi:MAG: hypothetical protein A2798_00830 [Candidatus Levybacteria bacterium RIFCSPHIGHO2_01_FULL_37_17]|nr:MAG: hypothetical protein A2798_00830 [Candidatus Levybacteria bacterium RIFCSPHIGHO2_01_FULL_37_17]OGH36995.1 MAG: hypothetical protein A2959_01690 [Candidatus Levybacteria bacterium RIFCSPLOWO2_01_FULL_38_23]
MQDVTQGKILYIVANFKSNKTEDEAKNWLDNFKNYKGENAKQIILCPPFTLLPTFKNFIKINSLQISLGAQNVSQFDEGPYTGEENAKQIKEFADYVLIGHSERRNLLNETDEMISEKVRNSISNELIPIFFVQTPDRAIPSGVELVVYEPPSSISGASGGIADDIDDVLKAAEKIKVAGQYQVLYGGSVNPANVNDFTSRTQISGVVVGKESLEADEFIRVIENA